MTTAIVEVTVHLSVNGETVCGMDYAPGQTANPERVTCAECIRRTDA